MGMTEHIDLGWTNIKNITDWCEENISPRGYHLPFNSGLKVGGEGWEVAYTGKTVRITIEDPTISTFVNLKFVNSR